MENAIGIAFSIAIALVGVASTVLATIWTWKFLHRRHVGAVPTTLIVIVAAILACWGLDCWRRSQFSRPTRSAYSQQLDFVRIQRARFPKRNTDARFRPGPRPYVLIGRDHQPLFEQRPLGLIRRQCECALVLRPGLLTPAQRAEQVSTESMKEVVAHQLGGEAVHFGQRSGWAGSGLG
jgi:hypothetical protein